jgi:hypothetical protein
MTGMANLCTGVWAREGGFDSYWRIFFHVLTIVFFFRLWIADIVMHLCSRLH